MASLFYSLPVAIDDVAMAKVGNALGENAVEKAKEIQKVCL
jgi:hypothetical protein